METNKHFVQRYNEDIIKELKLENFSVELVIVRKGYMKSRKTDSLKISIKRCFQRSIYVVLWKVWRNCTTPYRV